MKNGKPKRNYQRELDNILSREENLGKRLFLHSCCAPCSSYVLVYLRRYFKITVFYYNPNITEQEEYQKRVLEQKRLIRALNEEARECADASQEETAPYPIAVLEGDYEPTAFFQMAKGLETCPEGGERCFACYALRLSETVKKAQKGGYDYAATTLTVSPLKNAEKLNEIGEKLCTGGQVLWLPSDFKKRDGYKQSVLLSQKYALYRQDYCGCIFSRQERERQKEESAGDR